VFEEIGKRIRERRKELGLTQGDLGNHIGVSKPSVSGWELGKNDISGPNLIKLAQILRVSPDYILWGESGPVLGLDEARLARAISDLELSIGNKAASLSATQKAKLINHLYCTEKDHSQSDILALLKLVT